MTATETSAVVGAPDPTSQSGAAYEFVGSGTGWSKRAKLIPSDGTAGDNFGKAVALSRTTSVVGSPIHNSLIGAAYVYTNT